MQWLSPQKKEPRMENDKRTLIQAHAVIVALQHIAFPAIIGDLKRHFIQDWNDHPDIYNHDANLMNRCLNMVLVNYVLWLEMASEVEMAMSDHTTDYDKLILEAFLTTDLPDGYGESILGMYKTFRGDDPSATNMLKTAKGEWYINSFGMMEHISDIFTQEHIKRHYDYFRQFVGLLDAFVLELSQASCLFHFDSDHIPTDRDFIDVHEDWFQASRLIFIKHFPNA